MTEQEINEKLARWAGLHRNEPTGGTWWDKDGHTVDILFTESLDLQAKYLWPRLSAYQCAVLADTLGPLWWAKSEAAQASAQAIAKLLEGKDD